MKFKVIAFGFVLAFMVVFGRPMTDTITEQVPMVATIMEPTQTAEAGTGRGKRGKWD